MVEHILAAISAINRLRKTNLKVPPDGRTEFSEHGPFTRVELAQGHPSHEITIYLRGHAVHSVRFIPSIVNNIFAIRPKLSNGRSNMKFSDENWRHVLIKRGYSHTVFPVERGRETYIMTGGRSEKPITIANLRTRTHEDGEDLEELTVSEDHADELISLLFGGQKLLRLPRATPRPK